MNLRLSNRKTKQSIFNLDSKTIIAQKELRKLKKPNRNKPKNEFNRITH